MLAILGTLFVLIFAFSFFSIVAGIWRTRSMANKIFTLAEQELERKLRDSPAAASAASASQSACSHCGNRITATDAKCPSCGAGLS
jgi:rubrerythrin